MSTKMQCYFGRRELLQETVGCYEWRVAPIGIPHRGLTCKGTLESVRALGRNATELDHRLPLAIRLQWSDRCLAKMARQPSKYGRPW